MRHIERLLAKLRSGGFTVETAPKNLPDVVAHTETYSVGGGSWHHTLSADVSDGVAAAWLTHLVALAQLEGVSTLDGWLDGGTFYVEPVDLILSKNEALRQGRLRHEYAIYALHTGETIFMFPQD